MTFGTADRRKWDVAEGVALAVGHVAARRGNRLAVVDVRRPAPEPSPPRQGSSRRCSSCSPRWREPDLEPAGPTSLGAALRTRRPARARAARRHRVRLPRPARLAFAVAAARARHDVVAVEIRDPREQELTDVGQSGSSIPRQVESSRSTPGAGSCATGSTRSPPSDRDEVAAQSVRSGSRTSCSPRTANG